MFKVNRMTVAIVSERSLADVDGSSFRPLMQSRGLQANGFTDFKIFDLNTLNSFNESDFAIVHAHQRSGLLFSNYLVDLHGVFTRQFDDAISRYWFLKRRAARVLRFHEIEKMQSALLSRAKGIICAGESIEEFARPIGRAFLVRNCVDLNRYEKCDVSSTRIAVCGPFLKTYHNRYQLEYVTRIAKQFPRLSFLLIGRIKDDDLKILGSLSNVQVTGYVDSFIDVLRTCSILLAPYPSFTSQGGAKTKLIEAAACGMCIVATPYAVCDFYADDVLIGEETSGLARHLEYLTESESHRKTIGQKARAYVSICHSHLTETRKLIRAYEEFDSSCGTMHQPGVIRK